MASDDVHRDIETLVVECGRLWAGDQGRTLTYIVLIFTTETMTGEETAHRPKSQCYKTNVSYC